VVPRLQKTASCSIQSATTGFTANISPYRNRVSLKEALEGLEPYEAMMLFSDRTSTHYLRSNQLRLYCSSLACAEIASERKNSHAKRKTDQLYNSASRNHLATPNLHKLHCSSAKL
jgi:hypothetical protein